MTTKDKEEEDRLQIKLWEILERLAVIKSNTPDYHNKEEALADILAGTIITLSEGDSEEASRFRESMRFGFEHWLEEHPLRSIN
jgi:hypothetical protein